MTFSFIPRNLPCFIEPLEVKRQRIEDGSSVRCMYNFELCVVFSARKLVSSSLSFEGKFSLSDEGPIIIISR